MAFEVAFFKIHANLFVHGQPTSELLKKIRSGLLDEHIGRVTTLFIEQDVQILRLYLLSFWVKKLKGRESPDGKAKAVLDLTEDKQKYWSAT
ncbi:MAG: hypothetical protein LQ339_007678 [Xanthoria mediterranea]|nr:MAG: hypothetical protein LQ339_007678 [Xanthoria mediterranea]